MDQRHNQKLSELQFLKSQPQETSKKRGSLQGNYSFIKEEIEKQQPKVSKLNVTLENQNLTEPDKCLDDFSEDSDFLPSKTALKADIKPALSFNDYKQPSPLHSENRLLHKKKHSNYQTVPLKEEKNVKEENNAATADHRKSRLSRKQSLFI